MYVVMVASKISSRARNFYSRVLCNLKMIDDQPRHACCNAKMSMRSIITVPSIASKVSTLSSLLFKSTFYSPKAVV